MNDVAVLYRGGPFDGQIIYLTGHPARTMITGLTSGRARIGHLHWVRPAGSPLVDYVATWVRALSVEEWDYAISRSVLASR